MSQSQVTPDQLDELEQYIEDNFYGAPIGMPLCAAAIKIMGAQAAQIAALRVLVLELEARNEDDNPPLSPSTEPECITCPTCQGAGRYQVSSYPDGGAKCIDMEDCELCAGSGMLAVIPAKEGD